MTTQVLSYGGGRQTVAMCLLIEQGKLPRPDRVVIADTGREKQSTWDYLEEIVQPRMTRIGLPVEIASRRLAYVDLYGHNGDLLLPVYTARGKLSAFCSDEWKANVVNRYMKLTTLGYTPSDIDIMPHADIMQAMKRRAIGYVSWIGFALDERQRIKGRDQRAFPLVDLALTKTDCRAIITNAGLPLPPPSSCWMCPNMSNAEWRYVRDTYPSDFERACRLDEDIREEDQERGHAGVWLHHTRVPLRAADLDADDGRAEGRQCGLGMCFV